MDSTPPPLITLEEVCRLTTLKRTKIYALIKVGRFPKQFKLDRMSRWNANEVAAWIQDILDSR